MRYSSGVSPSRRNPIRLVAGVALLAGCLAETGPRGPSIALGPLGSLSVMVPELTMPLMSDTCFSVRVYRTADPAQRTPDAIVWSQDGLCTSERGGAGLALDLLAGCDPFAPGEGALNSVELELDAVYMRGAAGGDGVVLTPDYYANPCPAGAGQCVLTVPCDEIGTSEAVFDLALAAHPGLGVFETRVSLGEVFCSAKLDCRDGDGGALDYLVDPASGGDGPTAVLGLSCRGGAALGETFLYRDDVVVSCEVDGVPTRSARVDPSGGPGAVTPIDDGAAALFAAAVHRGIASDGVTFYWNVALGLALASVQPGETCTLDARAAAAVAPLVAGVTPEHARYPVIHWQADLFRHDGQEGALACERHPLGAGDGAVATVYTAIDTPIQLVHEMARGADGREVITSFDPIVVDPGWHEATIAFMEAIGIAPDQTILYAGTPQAITGEALWEAVDALVVGLVSDGLWERMRALYPFVGGTAAAHSLNLKDPRDLDEAYRLSFIGGVAHSPTGYDPNGSNGYADTHLSNAALPQDSLALATYNREGGNDGFEISGGAAPRTQLIAKYTNGDTYFDSNNAMNLSRYRSAWDGRGFYLSSRVSASTVKLFIDGALDRTLSAASAAPQDVSFKLSKWQGGNIFSGRELAFAMIAEGFSDAEAPLLAALVEAFQAALGRSVR